jgi:hypothetical protein
MTSEQIQIDQVITSIEGYCIGDIEYNSTKPIAAFMLSLCCIDVLGALRLNSGRNEHRFEEFLNSYVKNYAGLGIYRLCRNNVIHSYTSNEQYAVTNDKDFTHAHLKIDGKLIIQTDVLIASIKKGWETMKNEILNNKKEVVNNVIAWDTKHKLLRYKTI